MKIRIFNMVIAQAEETSACLTIKSHLSEAGFVRRPRRGKGSHSIWRHSFYPISVVLSGKDSSDVKPYQVKTLKLVLQQIAEN